MQPFVFVSRCKGIRQPFLFWVPICAVFVIWQGFSTFLSLKSTKPDLFFSNHISLFLISRNYKEHSPGKGQGLVETRNMGLSLCHHQTFSPCSVGTYLLSQGAKAAPCPADPKPYPMHLILKALGNICSPPNPCKQMSCSDCQIAH